MRKRVPLLLCFVAGLVVGWLLARRGEAPPRSLTDYTQPVEIRRGGGPTMRLVPHGVAMDGRSEKLATYDGSELWVIWFQGGRVQVAYTQSAEAP